MREKVRARGNHLADERAIPRSCSLRSRAARATASPAGSASERCR